MRRLPWRTGVLRTQDDGALPSGRVAAKKISDIRRF